MDKKENPTIVRRKRRDVRESTPDPSSAINNRGMNDAVRCVGTVKRENSAEARRLIPTEQERRSRIDESKRQKAKTVEAERPSRSDDHKSKILGRRDKTFATQLQRSLSQPREDAGLQRAPENTTDILSLLKRAKRSLSQPRKKDDSSDSGKLSDNELRKRIERREARSQARKSVENDEKQVHLDLNLRRFDEERRKFELEKLKFMQEKRELDRMRLRRFEKYRQDALEEQRQKLSNELRNRDEMTRFRNASRERPIIQQVIIRSTTPKKPLVNYDSTQSSGSSSGDEDNLSTSSEDEKRRILLLEKTKRVLPPSLPPQPMHLELVDVSIIEPEEQVALTLKESVIVPEKEEEPVIMSSEPQFKEEEKIFQIIENTEKPIIQIEEDVQVVNEEKIEESEIVEACIVLDFKNEDETVLVRRKGSKVKVEDTIKEIQNGVIEPKEMLNGVNGKAQEEELQKPPAVDSKMSSLQLNDVIKEWWQIWKQFVKEHPDEIHQIKLQRNSCFFYFAVMILLCGIGGIVFRFTEGTFEAQYKCGVKRVKRDFIDQLWHSSHDLKEEDWKQLARTRLRKFEEDLQIAFEAGMKSYSGNTAWNFINGVIYALTVVSTIGYGHISPSTTTGRALTILYAIIGIPIFLMVLADFGKLFTRGIKFVWSYVRRLYYTGSLRKVRKTVQVQEMMKGLNTVYDFVRRPSHGVTAEQHAEHTDEDNPATPMTPPSTNLNAPPPSCDTPTTPVPEIAIDDEFNLPITLAIFILVAYMLFGASIYFMWEDWSFFEAFYFVFISISTIGFGDYVPQHPIFMMCSIIYLIFGLALTSMCINVVQIKLSDSFRLASSKIGATIGFQMAEAASLQQSQSQVHTPVEIASVHGTTPSISVTTIEPKESPKDAKSKTP